MTQDGGGKHLPFPFDNNSTDNHHSSASGDRSSNGTKAESVHGDDEGTSSDTSNKTNTSNGLGDGWV